jgi:hypothetical protein
MFVAGKRDRGENPPLAVARRVSRRAERFDMIVATVLLALIVFGWALRIAPVESWPRGDFMIVSNLRQA